MKTCMYCGKELTVAQRHNKYCSILCANMAKKENTINDWKNNIFNPMKNNNFSETIRNYLLEQAGYKCQKCGWHEINPVTLKVPLEIHHIDGNYLNNTEDNLEVLCPNCHSLTPNYKSLNVTDRQRTNVRKNYCCDCGEPVSDNALRCKKCEGLRRITTKPITREELKDKIRHMPFTEIGKEFNVTDNAIKKWCIQYNLPSKKKDINLYSDEEWDKL